MYELHDKWNHQKWQSTFDKFFCSVILAFSASKSCASITELTRSFSILVKGALTHTHGQNEPWAHWHCKHYPDQRAHTNRSHSCLTMIHRSAPIISHLFFVPFNQWSWSLKFYATICTNEAKKLYRYFQVSDKPWLILLIQYHWKEH